MPTDARCPDCGSLVRDQMAWCTLCHADLRSPEEKEAARLESALVLAAGGAARAGAVPVPADTGQDLSAAPASGSPSPRGRHARPSSTVTLPAVLALAPTAAARTADASGPATDPATVAAASAAASAAAAAESEAKLAELREAGIDVDGMLQMLAADKAHDPLTGFVNDRLGSKGSRAIVILVASAVLTSLGILVMFVLGSVFG